MAGGDRRACDINVAGSAGAGCQFEIGRPTLESNRSVGFHPKKNRHRYHRRRVDGLPACRLEFFFSTNSRRRGVDTFARLLDVRARGHVGRKNFSQRIRLVYRADRVHVVSINFASAAHQPAVHHRVSVFDGLVGDEPLLLSVAVSLAQHLRRKIFSADPSPHAAFFTRRAVSVRRAAMVPSFLANVFATRVGRVDRARVALAAFDSGSRHKNFRGHVDDSLFVDGTRLSAFDNPHPDSPLGILASFLDADLGRRSFGFSLGWDESRQLVRGSRHDRRRVVFARSSVQREEFLAIYFQTRLMVFRWDINRVRFDAGLHRFFGHPKP